MSGFESMVGPASGLWVAAAASGLSALALGLPGGGRQRGVQHWQAALWLCTAGIVLAALAGDQPAAAPLRVAAQLVLLGWPLGLLMGLRRFLARVDWPGSVRLDALVFAFCALVVLAVSTLPDDAPLAPVAMLSATLLLHLYAASLLVYAGARQETRLLPPLAAVLAGAALAPMALALPMPEPAALQQTGAISAGLGAMASAFIVLRLQAEREGQRLRTSRRRLRALAGVDPLTQLPHRRHFEELASQLLAHDAAGSGVLMVFDIDHFGRLNTEYGHAGGDRALRLVARCVRGLLRADDVASRHGGDEFVLLLRRCTVPEALQVATRLAATVQHRAEGAAQPAPSLSFGVVQLQVGEGLASAMHRAGQALAEAKRQGRARAVAASGDEASPHFDEAQPLGTLNV